MTELLFTQVHQIAQHADDLERAGAFYRDVLGLRLIASFDPPGLVFFDLGNIRLLIERGAGSALLYLDVADIDSARAGLVAQSVVFVDEPHMIFDDADGTFGVAGTQERMTFFHDSEGNLVGLVEHRLTPA